MSEKILVDDNEEANLMLLMSNKGIWLKSAER